MTKDEIRRWIKPTDEILRRTADYVLIRRRTGKTVIFAWATLEYQGKAKTLGEARKSILEAMERQEKAVEAAKIKQAARIATTLPISSDHPEIPSKPHAVIVHGRAGDCVWSFPDGQKEGSKVIIQRLKK